ncbi:MspA family porin [Mycobacterium sp. Dal123C01]|uniref:MspA family porin n=1 Tax=Mycobacterium sp. Dal123C01 TaxID=3457577 RepID=UPI00403E6E82
MVVRRGAVLAVCLAMSVIVAPAAGGDPEAEPVAASAPNDGRVPSNPPATVNTPDGWILGLGAKDEMQAPVAPLTTAVSSREYLSSGIFVGSLRGPELAQGLLEVGYEIGCGIDMSTSNGVELGGNAGLTPSLGFTGAFPIPGNLLPVISAPVGGSINVGLKPGFVIVVPVTKKQFRGSNPWVMISNFHVKIDGCVGQSFIRSYATLTRSTDLSDVVLSYVGVTTAV